MDKHQERAIGRASGVVEDFLAIAVSHFVFFVRCHVEQSSWVCCWKGSTVRVSYAVRHMVGFMGRLSTAVPPEVARRPFVIALANPVLKFIAAWILVDIVDTLQTCIACLYGLSKDPKMSAAVFLFRAHVPLGYLVQHQCGIAPAKHRAVATQWFHLDARGDAKQLLFVR
jgi:hypothetical protein